MTSKWIAGFWNSFAVRYAHVRRRPSTTVSSCLTYGRRMASHASERCGCRWHSEARRWKYNSTMMETGLDLPALRRAAVRTGMLTAESAEVLDNAAAVELLYQPGVSTNTSVTTTSGRGVGMDVVREHVTRLGGASPRAARWAKETGSAIAAPLTLATTRALLVEEDGQLFAVPSAMVERVARVRSAEMRSVEGRATVDWRRSCPPGAESDRSARSAGYQAEDCDWRTYLILRQDERRVALLTGRLAGERGDRRQKLGLAAASGSQRHRGSGVGLRSHCPGADVQQSVGTRCG